MSLRLHTQIQLEDELFQKERVKVLLIISKGG